MERENCWVWFKGSLKEGGVWKGGFSSKKDENPGVLIQNPSYAQCRVPDWRISNTCLLYTSPSPRDATLSRMPSSA